MRFIFLSALANITSGRSMSTNITDLLSGDHQNKTLSTNLISGNGSYAALTSQLLYAYVFAKVFQSDDVSLNLEKFPPWKLVA
jgi:hypothetical protein